MGQAEPDGHDREILTQGVTVSNIKHGLRMELNRLPPGCGRIRKARDEMRQALEAAVVEARGTVGAYEAAIVQTACRWAAHGALAARWLRFAFDELSHAERLAFSREVCKASNERDRCLEKLGLGKPADPWSFLYESQDVAEPPAVPPPGDSGGVAVEPVGADPGAVPGNNVSREVASCDTKTL